MLACDTTDTWNRRSRKQGNRQCSSSAGNADDFVGAPGRSGAVDMKILFVGDSWLGSCARALREALRRRDDIVLDEVNEDLLFPSPSDRLLRALNKATRTLRQREFDRVVMQHLRAFRPDVLMVYKGAHVGHELVRMAQDLGALAVNIYPDCSPHKQGEVIKQAIGCYDLVVSTKRYQPELWEAVYGYHNPCVFVPHGYDSDLHLRREPVSRPMYDVALVATWRAEYGQLMRGFARHLGDNNVRVAIGGRGWRRDRDHLPSHWQYPGGGHGQSYVEAIRSARICVAPVTREVVVDGKPQPGDVDTTRSYELAAANCFFVHRRTEYMQSVYDEEHEVPMFDDAAELAARVRYYLAHPDERRAMAAAAHERAVPSYSIDERAGAILQVVRKRT